MGALKIPYAASFSFRYTMLLNIQAENAQATMYGTRSVFVYY